jgi:nitrate reductase / nitrite oxidoreductase, beta subunit
MNIRAQISMMFHLDKCIGCHTCSVSCKNIWTDRQGTEYMWWNNVETKPGTGYPTQWENQEQYQGGWKKDQGKEKIELRSTNKVKGLANIFHQPYLPTIDDYYEPWTYKYEDLFNAPASDDQPTAKPISLITGDEIDIKAGPNWDDDLGGSPIYASNDPNLEAISEQDRQTLFEIDRLVFFYLPRICNHCANPSCVASCPSGALYKRGEDGIVLVNQNVCRGWRFCVTACPYKKVYYNWKSGKSEKCILCFPRLETGQPPACFHSCVGRIRYLGVLLYDGDRIQEIASCDESELVTKQRELILNPFDPQIIAQAEKDGVHTSVIEAAQKSPVYKFVKEWKLALPLHPEFRTLPMLFYVPPLLPVLGRVDNGTYNTNSDNFFGNLEQARIPIEYLAKMFTAGNQQLIQETYRKLISVRLSKRLQEVGDLDAAKVQEAISQAGLTPELCEQIYRLTSLATWDERFVIPPMHREYAISMIEDTQLHKGEVGVGFNTRPARGL